MGAPCGEGRRWGSDSQGVQGLMLQKNTWGEQKRRLMPQWKTSRLVMPQVRGKASGFRLWKCHNLRGDFRKFFRIWKVLRKPVKEWFIHVFDISVTHTHTPISSHTFPSVFLIPGSGPTTHPAAQGRNLHHQIDCHLQAVSLTSIIQSLLLFLHFTSYSHYGSTTCLCEQVFSACLPIPWCWMQRHNSVQMSVLPK